MKPQKPHYILKGFIRGAYSKLQAEGLDRRQVWRIDGRDIEDVVSGLDLSEWIYTLYVNGKRIVDPVGYLKRKGVWSLCKQ